MIDTKGAKIALEQLQQELAAAGVDVGQGLGLFGTWLFRYTGGTPGIAGSAAQPSAFADDVAVQTVLAKHVAMRDLTDTEITVAYAQANDAVPPDTATMHNLVAMMQGLVPRTKVPM